MALASRLKDCRDRLPQWEPIYDRLVDHLRSVGVASSAPSIGDRLVDFALLDSKGVERRLSDLVASGPIVLCFIRGFWCPYCREEIAAWDGAAKALQRAGGQLVYVTAEVGLSTTTRLLGQGAETLYDIDHGVSLSLGLSFWCGIELQQEYRRTGLNLSNSYGNSSGILSVPATFVVDKASVVRFAFAEPDFRIRAEPTDVIEALSRVS